MIQKKNDTKDSIVQLKLIDLIKTNDVKKKDYLIKNDIKEE